MTYLLLLLAVVALSMLAVSAVTALRYLLDDRRRLDIIAERLAHEQRIELLTRSTLRAMQNNANRPPSA